MSTFNTSRIYRLIIWPSWVMLFVSWENADFLFYEEAPINYSDTKPKDPIAKMVIPYEQGKLDLDKTSEKAFLRILLATKKDLPAYWKG